ncbi:unnamed protein product [Gongylonema pulchrum]|uniref:ELMO domain-containing protein n=1 Tax=Gongylonema pulchrum TaxID=637853 RepID=A0A183D142_9BILA|nr:unnamed protein product [Gongylonema pulchrum]
MRIPTEAEIERFSQLKVFNGESSKADEKRAEFLSFREAVVKTPPGSLALETILSFGTRHADTIAKISLENSMRSDHKPWSFTVVSAHLVQMLIDILHIINEPGILFFFFFALEQRSLSTVEAHFFTEGERLMVLLFKSDRPFLDLFAVLVRLFHRTWREMHASDEDIKKVLAVVRKQMDVCLLEKPESIEKLEELLAVHSYPHMKKLWEDERSAKEAEELQSDAVKELREYLRPIAVADIQRVIAGGEGDFPMSGTKSKKNANVRGLTLQVGEKPDLYHLITSDEQTISAWCDGINALIGNLRFYKLILIISNNGIKDKELV